MRALTMPQTTDRFGCTLPSTLTDLRSANRVKTPRDTWFTDT
jgi:hypothetical protein